jgi:hypothetical protein
MINMKLLVATPCYNGNVNAQYMKSVLRLQSLLAREEIDMEFFDVPFDSLIPRARNACAMRFLKSDCTHMIFIDADISFRDTDVLSMMRQDREMLCGLYAKKSLDGEKLWKYTKALPDPPSLKNIVQNSCKLNVNGLNSDTNTVNYAATGFMMIQKKALEDFIVKASIDVYKNDIRAYGFGENCYDIFKCGVVNGRYLSEDYYFCKLWRDVGKYIHVDKSIVLTHIGNFSYHSEPSIFC